MTFKMSVAEGSKIGVCLDGGECSVWAFHLALLRINKHLDSLNLIFVAKAAGMELSLGYAFVDLWKQLLEEDLARGKALLREYGKEAKKAGVVNLHLFLVTASDISGKIIDFSNEHKLNHLFLGRRSLRSPLDRWLLGSVSKSVVEAVACNLTLVSTSFGPEEQHSSILGVKAAEEEERRRRIAHQRETYMAEVQAKINQAIRVPLEEDVQILE